jgi:hypothetical protein
MTEIIAREEVTTKEEEWRPVLGYEGWYEVSNFGQVKRIAKGRGARPGYILAQDERYDKCRMLNLMRGQTKTRKLFYVHRIVTEAFIGPIPEGMTVNHKDGDRRNNHASNLEIMTLAENRRHATETGLIPFGEKHWGAKLKVSDVPLIRKLSRHFNANRIAKLFNVTGGSIRQILRGKTWKHVA